LIYDTASFKKDEFGEKTLIGKLKKSPLPGEI